MNTKKVILDKLMKAADEASVRVSGYSKSERNRLLKEGRRMIFASLAQRKSGSL